MITKEQIEQDKHRRLNIATELLRETIEKIQTEYGVQVSAIPFIDNGRIVADINLTAQ